VSFAPRLPANLATLGNGLVGVGAIAYAWAGNPLWACLLIVSGVGFDGLDGFLARRAKLPPSRFGRVADSVSDALTFGVAPGVLLAYHTAHSAAWQSVGSWAALVALAVVGLTVGRLAYFTLWGYHSKDFLGVPSPTNALSLVLLLLLGDVPGLLGVAPSYVLGGALGLSVLMVVPIRFPKIRRGNPLRAVMSATAIAFVVSVLVLQFQPDHASGFYLLAFAATAVAAAGLALYYLAGPFTVPRDVVPEASSPP
jgi:CDP-diacylglycerol--serine O-phosphatidyltransferase